VYALVLLCLEFELLFEISDFVVSALELEDVLRLKLVLNTMSQSMIV
jgi:hypothetical protein